MILNNYLIIIIIFLDISTWFQAFQPNTNNFQTDLFAILTGILTPGRSGSGSNGIKEVLNTLQLAPEIECQQ